MNKKWYLYVCLECGEVFESEIPYRDLRCLNCWSWAPLISAPVFKYYCLRNCGAAWHTGPDRVGNEDGGCSRDDELDRLGIDETTSDPADPLCPLYVEYQEEPDHSCGGGACGDTCQDPDRISCYQCPAADGEADQCG